MPVAVFAVSNACEQQQLNNLGNATAGGLVLTDLGETAFKLVDEVEEAALFAEVAYSLAT